MKFYSIKKQLNQLTVFSLQDIYLVDPNFRQATLYDWEKTSKVIKLRNNCYIFSDFEPQNLDYYLLSNRIYSPSYVAMELALNHYGIIPEGVTIITAISTNKTQSFTTPVATFQYRSIRPELFFGYDIIEHRDHGIQLACLEKVILDYLYLHPEISSITDLVTLRWNKEELKTSLDRKKLGKYLNIYGSQSLKERVSILNDYLKE
ncbi:MAG: hypothetical protein ABIJ03_04025 [Patescibacteria group bacterium]|nr:hypothetical protein [Patescibacteria group bacterium]